MTDLQRYSEIRKLRRLTDLADRAAGDIWQLDTDARGTRVFVRRFDGRGCVILRFTRDANEDDIALVADALDNLTFFLPLIARASRRIRELSGELQRLKAEDGASRQVEDGPNYAAQAAMLRADTRFQRFLSEKRNGEVVEDIDAADAALKELLSITSKKQLTTDDAARQRWRDFHAEYSAWERGLM